jgi:hypothetical protein
MFPYTLPVVLFPTELFDDEFAETTLEFMKDDMEPLELFEVNIGTALFFPPEPALKMLALGSNPGACVATTDGLAELVIDVEDWVFPSNDDEEFTPELAPLEGEKKGAWY